MVQMEQILDALFQLEHHIQEGFKGIDRMYFSTNIFEAHENCKIK